MTFSLQDLAVPILGAPMAGGPSTPALAAAVSNAGGLGFVAAGYLSADTFADVIAGARSLTTAAIGVNIFVPQPSAATSDGLDRYRDLLAPLAEHYGAEVGRPSPTTMRGRPSSTWSPTPHRRWRRSPSGARTRKSLAACVTAVC